MGLLGLGGILFFTQANQAQEAAVATIVPTVIPATFTPTATFTATSTETPPPTPTATPVVGGEGVIGEIEEQPIDTPTVDPNATPTNTRVLQTPTLTATPEAEDTPAPPSASIPDSGGVLPGVDRSFLLWVGGGLLGLLIFSAFHHFKASRPTPQE